MNIKPIKNNMKALKDYFNEFEYKFQTLEKINNQWYCDNTGVRSNIKDSSTVDIKKNRSEEWIRARMVWSLVESGMYPEENICVEFNFPKGSEGAKSVQADIVIFSSFDWIKIYDQWDKKSSIPDSLAKLILVVFEAKAVAGKEYDAITKQAGEAMNSALVDIVYGVYFDNLNDLILLKKEAGKSLKRLVYDKEIQAIDDKEERLNLQSRDLLDTLPSFNEFLSKTEKRQNLKEQNFNTVDNPITEEDFTEILNVFNRVKNKLHLPKLKDLIVEFITLKVIDEKDTLANKKNYFELYFDLDNDQKGDIPTQEFRKRINKIYTSAKENYPKILANSNFGYNEKSSNLIPKDESKEKFLIEFIKTFQGRTIINAKNSKFNQIIFNNFGNDIDKAKDKQFFTPIQITEAIVKMINPRQSETICDPCAGICDFLASSFRYINNPNNDASNLYAIDKDPDILNLAQLNLVLNGDGNANINILNSISNKLLADGTIEKSEFDEEHYTKEWINLNGKELKKFDIILTNPPFGKGQDLKTGAKSKWDEPKKTLMLYETWSEVLAKRDKKDRIIGYPESIDLGIIFLENAYKSLKEEGRMAIILSNSIASIQSWSKVRKWFMERMCIVALFDLPANTFGETGVSTTVIIAYKPKQKQQELLAKDYDIFVKEIVNLGYEVKTKDRIVVMPPVYKIDENTFEKIKDSETGNFQLLTDLPDLVSEFKIWLNNHKHTDEAVYKAFTGESN
jgi:type I restriction enzyme M protein